MNKLKGIDNIIFDLGNVIIRLDIEATTKALQAAYGNDYEKAIKDLESNEIFNKYEKGFISSDEFYSELKLRKEGVSTKKLRNAWNAMLLDIPESRFSLLEKLKSDYRTFCLSNTNNTHISFINQMLKKTKGIPNLNSYFEKVYLSHEMGMRKPDVEIFEKVINDNQLEPNKTIFIDDTEGHLIGAKKAGLKTIHLPSFQLLEKFLL